MRRRVQGRGGGVGVSWPRQPDDAASGGDWPADPHSCLSRFFLPVFHRLAIMRNPVSELLLHRHMFRHTRFLLIIITLMGWRLGVEIEAIKTSSSDGF